MKKALILIMLIVLCGCESRQDKKTPAEHIRTKKAPQQLRKDQYEEEERHDGNIFIRNKMSFN